MEQTAVHILDYLKRTYDPEVILVYGSFAQGRNGPHSDFDACVLTKNAERCTRFNGMHSPHGCSCCTPAGKARKWVPYKRRRPRV